MEDRVIFANSYDNKWIFRIYNGDTLFQSEKYETITKAKSEYRKLYSHLNITEEIRYNY